MKRYWLSMMAVIWIGGIFTTFTYAASVQSGTKKSAVVNTPTPPSGKSTWQERWDKTVVAAQKEGRVRFYGEISSDTRQAIAKPFKDKYGIEVEFVTGISNELVQRMITERSRGLYLADAMLGGGTTTLTVLKPKGILQKLDSMLILPDVNDPSAWPNGKFPFLDDDHTAIALTAGVNPFIIVNTELVKEGAIKSFQDLLKPEYKGKIVFFNPTIGGTGVTWVNFLMSKVYKNDREGAIRYLRQFAAQEPIVLNDKRLQVEWVAKGKYPIAVAAQVQTIVEFVVAGAPIKRVHVSEGTDITAAASVFSMPVQPEHPNAAVVLLNWLLTAEGQRNFATAFGNPAVRVGIRTPVRDPSSVPMPGEKLTWEDEEFVLKAVESREVAKEIFGPLMK